MSQSALTCWIGQQHAWQSCLGAKQIFEGFSVETMPLLALSHQYSSNHPSSKIASISPLAEQILGCQLAQQPEGICLLQPMPLATAQPPHADLQNTASHLSLLWGTQLHRARQQPAVRDTRP